MLQSKYFIKTLRKPPKDETAINARLLEQACYIKKTMAGVYAYLPIGYQVLNNINAIIREEMNNIGGQELYLSALQPKELWDKTDRWDELKEIMYQFTDNSKREIGLGTTHEEAIAEIIKQKVNSYKDLPIYLYQIQDKFRDEPRAKSGLIRGREFAMKDLYSFHTDEGDLEKYYQQVGQAYFRIFKRCHLQAMITEASGGSFSKTYSHEFQVLSEAGEDRIIYCPKQHFAQNLEITKLKQGEPCPQCKAPLRTGKSIEVGNIFKLGTKFSKPLGAYYADKNGRKQPIVMASYGIGPGRLMGAIVETHYDKSGIIWPKTVTPFQAHLLNLGDQTATNKQAEIVYQALQKEGFEVLYDDRFESAGVKLNDADLIGITTRLVVSDKTGDKIEIKYRQEKKSELKTINNLIKELKEFYK